MTSRHRLLNDGFSPIPMGARAEYACVCGKRGTRADIERHIAQTADDDAYAAVVDDNNFGTGDTTKAHYLPVTPRQPARASAPPTFTDDPSAPELPPSPRPGGFEIDMIVTENLRDLHDDAVVSRSIAEAFQDMLRIAYQAGVLAATSGEAFESWYQREVMQ